MVGLSIVLTLLASAGVAADRPTVLSGVFEINGAKESLPKSLNLRLRPTATKAGNDINVNCSIEGRTWTCEAPAGTFDAELHATGYAPVYLWDVILEPSGTRNAGAIRFIHGAVVTGKVVDRGFGLKDARLELFPSGDLTGVDVRRNKLRSREATTDKNGLFTFSDVAAGTYTLVVKKDRYSSVSKSGIRVHPSREQRLDTMAMKPLAKLELFLSPPIDYYGEPWQFRLSRIVPLSVYHELVRSGSASQAGHWTAELLDASDYRLEILTSRGERIESRTIDLQQDTTQTIIIESVAIEGKLVVGGHPATGSVALIWEDGSRVAFRTNDEGEFAGIVPREGNWRATVRIGSPAAELHLPTVQVKRRPNDEKAKVHIELPAGMLQGTVVDEEGHPVQATVFLFRDDIMEGSTTTSPVGEFRFLGLKGGARLVNATAQSGSSGLTLAQVAEDDQQPAVTLVIRSTVTIRGTVVDGMGTAVPGARLHYMTSSSTGQQAGTGLAGDFSLSVPRGSPVAIAVVAGGLPKKLLAYTPSPEGEQNLQVVIGLANGRLHVRLIGGAPPWPFLTCDGVFFFALPVLFLPRSAGPPIEFSGDRYTFELEPGRYSICPEARITNRCATRMIHAGAEATVSGGSGGWR